MLGKLSDVILRRPESCAGELPDHGELPRGLRDGCLLL